MKHTDKLDFPCIQCGACCKSLAGKEPGRDLDRGDGVCRYLDGNLCSIYETRPLVCNVQKMYELYFKDDVLPVTFILQNLVSCLQLAQKQHNTDAEGKIWKLIRQYTQGDIGDEK